MKNPLNVKMAAKLAGINVQTLRAWERRYQVIEPRRLENGRRGYTLADVEKLKLLSLLTQEGQSIGQIAQLPFSALEELADRFLKQEKEKESPKDPVFVQASTDSQNYELLITSLLHHLHDFKLNEIRQDLMRGSLQLSIRNFILQIVVPLLQKVGRKVESQELSIAQEHAFSEVLRDLLGQMLHNLRHSKPGALRFVFATPETDLHEFGILLCALFCASHGFEIDYLGPNLPAKDLADAVQKLQSHVLILGTSPSLSQERLNLYFTILKKRIPSYLEIWVGGEAVQSLPTTRTKNMRFISSLEEFECELNKLKT